MAEHWYIIRCTSGQEGRAERYLERMGYPHGWHPTQKRRLSEAVYQRLMRAHSKLPSFAKSKKPSRYKIAPYVYGYVIVPAEDMEVHRVNGHHPQVWMGVLCVNGSPYRLTDAQMAEMRSVPERVRQLLDEAEKAAREGWEAKRPVVGGKARVMQGSFQGASGTVEVIERGHVRFDDAGMFGRMRFPQEHVERVA